MRRLELQSYGEQAAACFGKTRFEAYQHAQALKHARRMSQRCRESLVAYRCAHCDGWHVGHRLKAPEALALRAQQASGPVPSLVPEASYGQPQQDPA
jgi:hypothetical protein